MKLGRFAYCKRVRFVIALLKYLKPGRMTFYEIYIYIYFLGQDMFDQRLLQGCPKPVDGEAGEIISPPINGLLVLQM